MSASALAVRRSSRPVPTRLLWRLALHRDRLLLATCSTVLALLCLVSAFSLPSLYPSEAERVVAARGINANSGVVALYGPILDVRSEGELAMTKMTVLYAVFVSVVLLVVVRRHTRGDEESGRAELIGGAAVPLLAPLRASIGYGIAVSVGIGAVAAAASAVGGLPVAGSAAFGACWAGTGLVATGTAALAAQVSASARTCAGVAASAFALFYALRIVGDTSGPAWIGWLSPYGWNTRLRAFGDTRWWVLLLYAALAASLSAGALALRRRRDLGAGLVAARPGPPTGSPRLADAVALSLRVHAPMLAGWTVAVALTGVLFGAVIPGFDTLRTAEVQEMLARVGGTGPFRDTMLAAVLSVLALVVTCFAVAVVGHAAADEADGRTEQVLATATSRSRVVVATVLVAAGGATWLLLVTGVALAAGLGAEAGHSLAALVGSALAQAPAVWTVTALALLCLAAGSRWAAAGWGLVVLFATLGQVGALLRLPQAVLELSPYTHAPRMPHAPFDAGAALALTGCAALVLAAAWARLRSRDVG